MEENRLRELTVLRENGYKTRCSGDDAVKKLIEGKMVITDARKIQQRISRRLNELKKRRAKLGDIEYLSVWTRKLYESAKERDCYAQKLHHAKRAFIIAFSDPSEPKKGKERKG